MLRDKGLTALTDDGTEIVALSREDEEPVVLTQGGASMDYELRPDGSMEEIRLADVADAVVELAWRQDQVLGQVAGIRDQQLSEATAALSHLARAATSRPGDADAADDAVAERVPVGDVLASRYRGTGRDDVYAAVRGLAQAWGMPQYAVREQLEEYAESHLGLSSSSSEDWALMAAAADLGGSGSLAAAGASASSEVIALAASGESADERRSLAARGWALPDGSYPIPDIKRLHSAAVLAASHHGDWQAARRLIIRRAKDLGVDLSTLPGFGDKVAASALLEQADAVALQNAGQMAGTNWSLGVGGTLELAAGGMETCYGMEAGSGHPLHAPHVHLGAYDDTGARLAGSEDEVARLCGLYEQENHLAGLAAPGAMHDGHAHRHRHDGGAEWHDGHGGPLDEAGEHSHPHEHSEGRHAHGHSEADLQEAANPGSDIRRQPADVAPREPQVPPSSPWAQPGRVGDRVQREVDRITTAHAAEFHGGLNKVVTSATRARTTESFADTRQPKRGNVGYPGFGNEPAEIAGRRGRRSPPGRIGQRDYTLAGMTATDDHAAEIDRLVKMYDEEIRQ